MAAAFTAPVRALDFSELLGADPEAQAWLDGRADAFAGLTATPGALFRYGGFTLAPGGLERDGLRLRAYSGSGTYTYTSRTEISPGRVVAFDRHASAVQAEALIGWQVSTGAMTAKLFAGLSYEDQQVAPADPENSLAGTHFGAKLAVETWFDLTEWLWLSADASYATTLDAYSSASKLGLKPFPSFSFGPAAAASGSREFDSHRLGGFVRWHCGGCDVTLSGGISGDYDGGTGGYGVLSFYRRF